MSLLTEFKEFISRGNAMDMAVGVIVGGAFTAIVTSLTDDIINPLIKLVTGGQGAEVAGLTIPVTEGVSIDFGAFISAVINFLIIALIVFMLIKGLNSMSAAGKKLAHIKEAEAPVIPTCPYCLEEVKAGSTRCPHCAGEFDKPAGAEAAEAKAEA